MTVSEGKCCSRQLCMRSLGKANYKFLQSYSSCTCSLKLAGSYTVSTIVCQIILVTVVAFSFGILFQSTCLISYTLTAFFEGGLLLFQVNACRAYAWLFPDCLKNKSGIMKKPVQEDHMVWLVGGRLRKQK